MLSPALSRSREPLQCLILPLSPGGEAASCCADTLDSSHPSLQVKYKNVMKQYNLGPNGGILTSCNLFATRFDQVRQLRPKEGRTQQNNCHCACPCFIPPCRGCAKLIWAKLAVVWQLGTRALHNAAPSCNGQAPTTQHTRLVGGGVHERYNPQGEREEVLQIQ